MKNIIIFGLIILSLAVALPSCKEDNPVPPEVQESIELTVKEVASTEAWLTIKTINISLPAQLQLVENGSYNIPVYLESPNTTIYIKSLGPKETYEFKVIQDNSNSLESNTVILQTLDTTSNEIVWQIFQFGDTFEGFSYLEDVCIENESSVWGVGEYYLIDSLGNNDSEPYGAVNWNGAALKYYKVYCRDYGTNHYSPGKLTACFEINGSVYATSYTSMLKMENNTWIEKAIFMNDLSFNTQVFAIAGTEENNLYCAGWNGGIFNVTADGWKELNSQTTNQILDVWAYIDPSNGDKVALFPATDWSLNTKYLIKLVNNVVSDTIPIGILSSNTVWTKNGFPIFLGNMGIIDNKNLYFSHVSTVSTSVITKIRGTNLNDIFACNMIGEVYHYNGMNWKSFIPADESYEYTGVSVRGNTIALSGYHSGRPLLVIGKRN